MQLGAIADDITGGTDLASRIGRAGLAAVQILDPSFDVPVGAEAVVVSLKTRTVPPGIASAQSAAAARMLRRAGAHQLYFKYCSTFDSTDQGNIGPVIDELLDVLDVPFTVACPAYPALSRTVYAGHLFVNQQLLSESSMRNHPLTPMHDANLVRVLQRQSRTRVGLVPLDDVERGADVVRASFRALIREGRRVAIVDAIFDRHLDTLADASRELGLVTGGAALGGAIARRSAGSAGTTRARHFVRSQPVAILSGSCSAATQEQVRRLSMQIPARPVDPLALAEDETERSRVIEWAVGQARRHSSLLVYSTADGEAVHLIQDRLGRDASAALLERMFASLATALAGHGVRTFVIAGGETSGAVLQGMGIRALTFGEEVEPGVPWAASIEPPGFVFALKSGNFGGPDFFFTALEGAA